jgi:NAD(P)H dehydrogenase (quinone)
VADRAALISKISGNPIEVVKASSEEIRRDLEVAGFPVEYCDFVLDIKRKTAEAGYDIVTGDVERLSGRPPVFLRDVMANYLAAGVG